MYSRNSSQNSDLNQSLLEGNEVEELYRDHFWGLVESEIGNPVPQFIKNIFKFLNYDKHSNLELMLKDNKNNDKCFPYKEVENVVRNEMYKNFVNENLETLVGENTSQIQRRKFEELFYGRHAKNPANFFFNAGEKLSIRTVLNVVKKYKNHQKFWKIKKNVNCVNLRASSSLLTSSNENHDNNIDQRQVPQFNTDYNGDYEKKDLLEKIKNMRIPSDVNFEITLDSINIEIEKINDHKKVCRAKFQCPLHRCTTKFNFVKIVDRANIQEIWKNSNIIRHIYKRHSSEPRPKRRKNVTQDQAQDHVESSSSSDDEDEPRDEQTERINSTDLTYGSIPQHHDRNTDV